PGAGNEPRAAACAGRRTHAICRSVMSRSPALTYRPDIDGLRAIAVIIVVGFHAWPRAFRGGFVGVDVFFVISGYLISGLVLNGLIAGKFSFADFYVRR